MDDIDAVLPDLVDPAVRIDRGALGAYDLQLEANNNAARAIRVK